MAETTTNNAWPALQAHWQQLSSLHISDLFAADPQRAAGYTLEAAGLRVDLSRHRVTERTRVLLEALATERGVTDATVRMFAGERINVTEERPVLHVALRDPQGELGCRVDGHPVAAGVREVLRRAGEFADQVRDGSWRGHTGEPITDVVHLGIGGSALGPEMVCTALDHLADGPRCHFVSNVDGSALHATLAGLDAATTLFVVASKTFTTQETLLNAHTARDWLLASGAGQTAVANHFAAATTNIEAAAAFGIDPAHMFGFWDWVGGRYSLWSAIGLPIMLAVGRDGFAALLAGAHAMDLHFRDAPAPRNLPLQLGLLGIWYHNFFGCETHAVVPYDHRLRKLPAFLQQVDMESNGKRVMRDGTPLGIDSGPIVWGGVGTDAQHAFFQLLHQGTRLVPVDFIVAREADHPWPEHHRVLRAHCAAQADALAFGRDEATARAMLEAGGLDAETLERQLPHRLYPGNRPSTTIEIERLTPHALGALIALYEHKVFVQGTIWGINSFDQWGVELGKQLAGERLAGA